MADKSWMLNPKAIRTANDCIQLVKELKGQRLKLSQPDFMQQLHQFVDQAKSRELDEAYSKLLSMAGVGDVIHNLEREPAQAVVAMPRAVGDDYSASTSEEVINLDGQNYPKFRNGREFKGLFRGIPRYR